METTRRNFLKIATVGGAAASVFGFDLTPAYAQVGKLKIAAERTGKACVRGSSALATG
ncbi:MAG TPA: twin-arginine translocation signal domain-containing protein [Candidatus Cybelea sp.]|nr:twin-arginine translocation signal domain-containing protein [Candidatus Cybelea sp.]